MKESFWGYWIIVLGIFVIIIMMLISSVTTTNTQDYYMIKDVTEAAMIDAIDYSYYRQYQELKINREKFVENFLRRFAENVSLSTYTIDFYDLYEAPPKVSVKVTTKSGTFSVMGDSTSFDIVNKVDSILENSGTAGSTNRDTNSSIKSDGTVSTSKGIGIDGSPSTVVTPGNPSGGSSNVPTASDISKVTTLPWFQSKYMTGGRIKDSYLNDPTKFLNELLADWQKYNKDSFSSRESNEFLRNAVRAFPWATSGLDIDTDDYDDDDDYDYDYDDDDDGETKEYWDYSDSQIESMIKSYVNSGDNFYDFYDCDESKCILVSLDDFENIMQQQFWSAFNIEDDDSFYLELSLRCEAVYKTLPKMKREK